MILRALGDPNHLPDVGRIAVEVGDERDRDEHDHARDDHAGECRVHVQQKLLQVQEVPRSLGRVRRLVRVGHGLERRLQHHAHDDQAEHQQHRGQELEHDQVRPDVDEPLRLVLGRGGWTLPFGDRGDLFAPSRGGGRDARGHAGAGWPLEDRRTRAGRRGRRWPGGRGWGGRWCAGGLDAVGGGVRRPADARGSSALLVDGGALGGRQALHVRCAVERVGHQSGPEMPPSLRMRQKWTAIRIAAPSGSAMTCSVYQRMSVLSPRS